MKKTSLWKYSEPDPELERKLTNQLNVPAPVTRVLLNRGINTPDEAHRFLFPSLKYSHSPWDLKGVSDAVSRIIEALEKNEEMTIYGDYDVDGIASTVLLVKAIRGLGGRVNYYLPSRFQEGYGLQKEPLLHLWKEGTTLLITTDCGTNSIEEVNYAQELGIDVIVTDHHYPLFSLDTAVAVINPHQEDCYYPWSSLSGTGVAYKLVQALLETAGEKVDPYFNLDLVALGTIADLVPLLNENRVLTRFGLECLSNHPQPGISALLYASGLEKKSLSAHDVAFVIAPSLNAAGRMGSADPAAELLLVENLERANEIARFLYQENQNRRQAEQKIFDEARTMIEEEAESSEQLVLVLASQHWHQGIVGIVASRLLELYYRPVILIALEGSMGKGSARSIAGFNITAALKECSDLLDRYGGHTQAAGLTVSLENIARLRERLNKIASKWIKKEDLRPSMCLEGELTEDEIDLELAYHLEKLAPYGVGNPYPRFCSKGWHIKGWRRVGKEKQHIKFNLEHSNSNLSPILFEGEEYMPRLIPGRMLDLVLTVSNGTWKERSVLNLVIKDLHFTDGEMIKGLEIIDFRKTSDRLDCLHNILSVAKIPLVYAGTVARKEYLEKKFNNMISTQSVVAANQIHSLVHEMERKGESTTDLILFHLPVRAKILETIIKTCHISSTIRVHLLYNDSDREVNKRVMEVALPSHSHVYSLYHQLKKISDHKGIVRQQQIDTLVEKGSIKAKGTLIEKAMAIMEEIGLVIPTDRGWQLIFMEELPAEKELAATDSYQETQSFYEECDIFQDFMLTAPKEDILKLLQDSRDK